ncbi:MAG: hypothetical protein KDK70_12905, partial [Myxococcales bacterium]|nr:hypothetical protein [Myxococcales bacterium]
GGKDADGDGRDDIDQLFVAHGLFADLDGDRQHDPGEALGMTSHPGRAVEVDGAPQAWPALVPRHRLTLPPALHMQVDVEPPEATVLVVVGGSAWGGYLARPGAGGALAVIPPPAGDGHRVSVVALATDRRPTALWSADATALLADLETHGKPYLAVQATLPPASRAAAIGEPGGWARLAFGGGALAALVGLVLMAIGWPRLR